MAKATRREPITQVVKEGGVTLDLSFEEANALRTVLTLHGTTCDEFDTYPVWEALGSAGATYVGSTDLKVNVLSSGVYALKRKEK